MSSGVGKKGILENLRIVKIVAGGGEIPLTGLGRRKVEKVEGRAGEYVQVSSMDRHSTYIYIKNKGHTHEEQNYRMFAF